MKIILCLFILFIFVLNSTSGFAQKLVSAKVIFFTPDCGGCDNKDYDTKVSIMVYGSRGRAAAWVNGSSGVEFKDNNSYNTINLNISTGYNSPNLDKPEFTPGRMSVRVDPNGKDDWVFQPTLVLGFADGTSLTFKWNGNTELSKDHWLTWFSFQ